MPVQSAPDPGASRSLRRRLAAGPVARAVARADLRVYTAVRSHVRLGFAHRAITAYTRAGEHGALWYGIGAAALVTSPGHARCWKRGMAAVLTTELVNTAVKTVARRRRPAVEELPSLVKLPTSMSFPSAHSSTSFAAARVYSAVLPSGPLYGLAAAMALSRVYVGVHYPSDVTVGAGLGLALGSLAR